MGVMDPGSGGEAGLDFVEEFASAAEWFAAHLARTSARTPVPSCVPWTVVDLTAHLGNTHSWAATVMETGKAAGQLEDRPASARARRVSEWYLGKAEDLYEVLRSTDPDKPCWNFAFGSGTASFWSRRQAHETVMHGIDLALAGDHQERLPDRLALDGVAEVLDVFLPRMHHRGHPATLYRAVELRAMDFEVSWLVEPSGPIGIPAQGTAATRGGAGAGTTRTASHGVPRVTRGRSADADLIEASAATLLKLLWKRTLPTASGVHLIGDEDRLLAFLHSRLTP
jgi:uncharacterized protein (TIGR03083 family)